MASRAIIPPSKGNLVPLLLQRVTNSSNTPAESAAYLFPANVSTAATIPQALSGSAGWVRELQQGGLLQAGINNDDPNTTLNLLLQAIGGTLHHRAEVRQGDPRQEHRCANEQRRRGSRFTAAARWLFFRIFATLIAAFLSTTNQ